MQTKSKTQKKEIKQYIVPKIQVKSIDYGDDIMDISEQPNIYIHEEDYIDENTEILTNNYNIWEHE